MAFLFFFKLLHNMLKIRNYFIYYLEKNIFILNVINRIASEGIYLRQ